MRLSEAAYRGAGALAVAEFAEDIQHGVVARGTRSPAKSGERGGQTYGLCSAAGCSRLAQRTGLVEEMTSAEIETLAAVLGVSAKAITVALQDFARDSIQFMGV